MTKRRKKSSCSSDTITITIVPRESHNNKAVTLDEMRGVIDRGMLDLGLWMLAESLNSEEDSHPQRLRVILRGLDHSVERDKDVEDGPDKREAVRLLKMASTLGRTCEWSEYNMDGGALELEYEMEREYSHKAVRAVRKIYPTYFADLPALN